MKLTFIGADHEVTGSCHYLDVCGKKILIDCGMEQGENIYENVELPVSYGDIDYVFLTHAHIDHAGYLPLIYAKGFKGKIFATKPTCELSAIMLKDSAHIQEFEAKWKNRKAKRAGNPEVVPLYEMKDVEGVMKHFIPCEYEKKLNIAYGIEARFIDVGHLLGSASIELWLTEDGVSKKIVFSGDIGNTNKPIIKDPHYIHDADYVVMESTYGDRFHGEKKNQVEQIAAVIQRGLDNGGNVVIPAFAVGRTQEILYFIRKIKADNLVKGHDGFPVYVDSPLAIEATHVFSKNMEECFDEETNALLEQGINPISFPGLKLSITSEDSMQINFDSTPKVIISASGMCDAGRIRHHLKHNLWRSECSIMFAGYQAAGTIGRTLVEGRKVVKLFGEEIQVNANIEVIDGISGHADKNGLLKWITEFGDTPSQVFVVHGRDETCDSFAQAVTEATGISAKAPFSGSSYDLIRGEWIEETVGVRISKEKEAIRRATGVYGRLCREGERLLAVIKRNEGVSNKDLAKFADQISALSDKWDR